jgi:hypothetical protein
MRWPIRPVYLRIGTFRNVDPFLCHAGTIASPRVLQCARYILGAGLMRGHKPAWGRRRIDRRSPSAVDDARLFRPRSHTTALTLGGKLTRDHQDHVRSFSGCSLLCPTMPQQQEGACAVLADHLFLRPYSLIRPMRFYRASSLTVLRCRAGAVYISPAQSHVVHRQPYDTLTAISMSKRIFTLMSDLSTKEQPVLA